MKGKVMEPELNAQDGFEQIADQLETTNDMIGVVNEVKAAAEADVNTFDSLRRKTDSILQQAKNEVTQNMIDNTYSMDEMVARLDTLINKVDKLCNDAKEESNERYDKILGDMEKIDKRSLGDIIADDMKRHWQNLKETVTALKTNVANGIKAMGEAAKNGLNFIKEKTVGFFKAAGEKAANGAKTMGTLITETAGHIADGASYAASKVSEAAKAGKDKVTELRANISKDMEKHLEKKQEKLQERLDKRHEKTESLEQKVAEGKAEKEDVGKE